MDAVKKSPFKVKGKIISSLQKVMTDDLALKNEEYSAVMLKNEQLNFQLVFNSEENFSLLRNYVRVEGSLSEFVSLRLVENVPVEYVPTCTDDYFISKNSGLYPDLLSPMPSGKKLGIVLMPAKNRTVWVSVYCKKGLPAGMHTLKFMLFSRENELLCELSYKIEVVAISAKEAPFIATTWMHYDAIMRSHSIKGFCKKFYSIFAEYLKAYVHGGMNMLLTPLFTPPLDTEIGAERQTAQLIKVSADENGKYSFDFSELEKFIRFSMRRGIKYIEFSHLFTQWGGYKCPKIMASTPDGEKNIFGWGVSQSDPRYAKFLSDFLPELIKTTDKLGVTDKCFFHLTDEPALEQNTLENYKRAHELVKKHITERPIMDAMSHTWFYENGLVDLPVVYTENIEEFKNKGITDIFAYYCCYPATDYYSNRHINMPALRTRVLGVQLYESGVKGFLHWGFNFYNSQYSITEIDPYRVTDAGGAFPAGDSFIVYPAGKTVLLSIRAELMREAMQDYNLLYTLEELAGRDNVNEILKQYGISGYNTYPREESVFAAFKQKIYSEIKRAAGL